MTKEYYHDGANFNQLSPEKIFEISKAQDWYTDQGMMGFVWAKQNLDAMEQVYKKYSGTDLQKYLWWQVLNVPALYDVDNWWYWCNEMHKSFLARFRYLLRRVDGLTPVQAIRLYIHKGATIWKERIYKTLEILSWDWDKDIYFANFPSGYRAYGLTKDEDWKRFENRHTGMAERENIIHFEDWKVKYN